MTAPAKILVVDDNAAGLKATARVLSQGGYDVLSAQSAGEGLRLAREQRPNLVLLDVMLPDMPFPEALRAIRADPALNRLCVVLLSALRTSPEQQASGLDEGADGYIARPVANQELLARVRMHLRQIELTAELVASEARFRNLIAQQADGVLVVDPDGVILYANAAAGMLFGVLAEQLIGQPFGFPIGEDDPIEIRGRGYPGDRRLVGMRVSETLWEGRPARLATLRDLTQAQTAAEVLRQNEELLRGVFDQASAGICVASLDGQFLRTNARFGEIVGYPPEELIARSCVATTHADDRAFEAGMIQKMLAGEGTSPAWEKRYLRKDGSVVWASLTLSLLRDGAGKPQYFIGVILDITDRKRADEALQKSEQEQRQLVQQVEIERSRLLAAQAVANVGSWETDLATFAMTWSDETHRIFETDPATFEPTHRSFLQIVHPDDRQAVDRAFVASLQAEESCVIEHRLLLPGGRVKFVEERWRAFADASGKPVRAVGTCLDITERKLAERLLTWEAKILESVSSGLALAEVLEMACLGVEDLVPGSTASILLVDADGTRLRHGAAPNLPAAYVQAIDGVEAGPAAGSCGTAVHRRAPVIVQDIETDALWANYRVLASEHGLRACWSMPVMDAAGAVRASFAVYYREPRSPKSRDLDLLDRTAHIVGIAIQRDRKEAQLRATEERFRRTFLDAAVGIAITAVDGRILEANAAYSRMVGYTPEELREIDFLTLIHPDDRQKHGELMQQMLGGQRESFILEKRYLKKDGAVVWARTSISPMRNAVGIPVSIIRIFEDITQQRRAEQELDRSQGLLRMATHVSRLGAWAVDLPDLHLTWSEELREIVEVPPGYTPTVQEAIGYYVPEHREIIGRAFETCVRDGTPYNVELQFVTARGRRIWVRSIGEAVRDQAGRIVRVQGGFQDITKQRSADAHLRLLETAVSRLNDIVIITEAEPFSEPGPRMVFVNDAFERRTGYTREEALGKTPRILQGPGTQRAELDRIRAALENWQPVRAELLNYAKDGTEFWLELDIVPIADETGWFTHWVAVERDVTERRALEEQLRQSQRLEAVGQLTGGVAHDFNNLLTVILGNAELLEEELAGDARHRPLAQMIAGAAQRGAELTSRLLAFSRKQALDPKPTEVNRLVAEMDGLLRRSLGEHVEIEVVRGGGLWEALVDAPQLESAVLNLAINARDAMAQGGRLTIETANTRLDDAYAAQHADVVAGQYVMLAVSDTGTGIAPEHLPRVFEPFFTTKEKGKGTGLGLAMVYGFIKQSGGHVSIYSEPGHGTTVKLYLPRVEAQTRAREEVRPEAQAGGGHETILLVEDDALVRTYALGQLRALGYDVIEAQDGPQALQIIAQRADIDLLFTDVVMPGGMSGRQLADEARRLRPTLKVLYTSGYTENAIVHQGRLDPGVHLLSKPYRRAELARKVRELLELDAVNKKPREKRK